MILFGVLHANFEKGFEFYNKKLYDQALSQWQSACEISDTRACNVLALMYSNGEYVKQDNSVAKQYYKKACDGGDEVGCRFFRRLEGLGY
jgi:hypothetical protein